MLTSSLVSRFKEISQRGLQNRKGWLQKELENKFLVSKMNPKTLKALDIVKNAIKNEYVNIVENLDSKSSESS